MNWLPLFSLAKFDWMSAFQLKLFDFDEFFPMKLLKTVLNFFASNYGFLVVRNNPSNFHRKIPQFCVCCSASFYRFIEYYYLINKPFYVGFSFLTNTKAPQVVKTPFPCEPVLKRLKNEAMSCHLTETERHDCELFSLLKRPFIGL